MPDTIRIGGAGDGADTRRHHIPGPAKFGGAGTEQDSVSNNRF